LYASCNAAAPAGADDSRDDAELLDGFQIAAAPAAMTSNATSAHRNLHRCPMCMPHIPFEERYDAHALMDLAANGVLVVGPVRERPLPVLSGGDNAG
jgi:hypothetical protein